MMEQTKVLFIVYRTEWWGCLDSLCRQECLKEGTLVYVMPVPRYDRDLGTTEMNYAKVHFTPEQLEGELPEGASLVDCQTFSLEQGFERIYIHNPYDNTYYVDSVDEKYYSWNLKPYAKKLIYVPHLLCIGGLPEFVTKSPICEHVDAIYVPKEDAKYSLEVQYDQKVEVVPSGIPEYLEKLEERLKGEKKEKDIKGAGQGLRQDAGKELLCCLSYDNLSYGTEKVVQKLQSVFEYLRGRKDIRLVFRPDEDIRARFGWLPEPVRKKYVELVTYFQKNRVGVYDETADLYRAVVKADGILSFGHPADNLFGVQGKYVLHLDNVLRPIPSDEVRRIPSLWAVTAVEEEDRIELWFVPGMTKLICRMVIQGNEVDKNKSLSKGKKAPKKQAGKPQIEIIAEVPDDIIDGLNYINITKTENCLYLSPYDSKSIWKYDLNSRCFSGQYLSNATRTCIMASFLYGKYLYMIPGMHPGIIKYDTETEEVEIIDGWVEELERYVMPECRKESYFYWATKQEKNMLYMASSKCDVWMEFDMDRDAWKMKPMNLPKRRFVNMVKIREWVWLFPCWGDEVILWNCMTNESQLIYKMIRKEDWYAPYEFGIDIGDYIAAFPGQMDSVLLIPAKLKGNLLKDKTEQNMKSSCRVPCRDKDYLSEYQSQMKIGYQFVKRIKNGEILAYEYYDGAFLVLNEALDIIRKYYCRLPLEVVRQQQNKFWENAQCSNEFNGVIGEGYFLSGMVDFFVQHGQENRSEISGYYKEKLKG